MIKNILILLILILSGVGYTFWTDQGGRQIAAPPQTVEEKKTDVTSPKHMAPDFSFTDLKGRKFTLSNFRGKAVVLNFWASWCAPCVIEFPQMLALAGKNEKDSVFIFLSQDDDRADIDRFLKKQMKALPQKNVIIAKDENKKIAQDLFQTFKLPETYLIDRKGIIRDKIIGADIEWDGVVMQETLHNLSRQ